MGWIITKDTDDKYIVAHVVENYGGTLEEARALRDIVNDAIECETASPYKEIAKELANEYFERKAERSGVAYDVLSPPTGKRNDAADIDKSCDCTTIGPRVLSLIATGNARFQLRKPLASYIATVHIGQVVYNGTSKESAQEALNSLEQDIKSHDLGAWHLGDVERREHEA